MTEEARDSGICVDNDCCESLSSATSSCRDHNQLSYVQRLRKRFECLAKEQEVVFHDEVNWWLHEEVDENINDEVIVETSNIHQNGGYLQREFSRESEPRTYSRQPSIKSQISHDSGRESTLVVVIPPTPPVKAPSSAAIIFSDYQENNETNDSDSFDGSEGEAENVDEKDDEVFEEQFQRKSENSLRLSRPLSITSQTSK